MQFTFLHVSRTRGLRPFRSLLVGGLIWFGVLPFLFAQPYVPPVGYRSDINLDLGWRFIRQDVGGAPTNGFDDSKWTSLDLPHTWNNLDGQDGGNGYYRGIGWYRRHFMVDASAAGRRLFLKFDGANIVSDVYVNGNLVGEHQGGFAAFVYDVTTNLNVGGDNVIAVKVNNAVNPNVPPLSADFTFFGGLYRDVHLLITDPVHISPLDYGSPGIYLQPTGVSSNSANLQVTTIVSNASPELAVVALRVVITDAATNIVAALKSVSILPAGSVSNIVTSTIIANPHLWNGVADPYLYQAYVEIYNGPNLTDVVKQPLGLYSFNIDPTNGFFLNGKSYDVHGVCMHQDFFNLGWALTDAQRQTNFALLKELGVTGVRLAHYQHAEGTYQLADASGILLWTEVPLVNNVNSGAAFLANAQQQLRELIRQNYNHPSIFCWGVFNEITLGTDPVGGDNPLRNSVVSNLVQLVAQEDTTRLSVGATLASNGDATSWMPQIIGFNEYFGWYQIPTPGIGDWADARHAAHPTNCFAISEYGAGASIYQHSENPVTKPGLTGAPFHPEEWQNLVHEANWPMMKARPFLWGKFLWNMFDFAVDGRDEGGVPGRNDKGIATYDRLVRKDVFYYYKANWTTNPMVYITGHTFTNRLMNGVTAKVYANCDAVELFVNSTSQGSRTGTNCIFTWPITLGMGSNSVQAIGTKGSAQVTDSLNWSAPLLAPIISVVTPVGAVAALNNTNNALLISVNVSNPVPAFPMTKSWSSASGPAPVFFADSNALTTVVYFSSNGVYNLVFTANNRAAASVRVRVLVNFDPQITNGLAAWWKMDESGGAMAADASGNGRTAAVTSGIFTTGYISNAIKFYTWSSLATYSAQQSNQVTVVAWVRCDAPGGGNFPRIVDTPSYRFMFRFSSVDANSVGFATYDGINGDFDSGADTISLGTWYHIAASYDRSSLTNRPTFYVNGAKLTATTLTAPSGSPPLLSGTGYIGNNSVNTRNWNGLIDDLRIYDRLLSDVEIQILAAPLANVAPIVSAGTNQVVIWSAAANLNGSVADDGNPLGVVTTVWSQLSGPGTMTFDSSNTLATTASFSIPGVYVVRLTADDGQVKTCSDVSIIAVIRPTINWAVAPGSLHLSWETFGANWRLQTQTNSLSVGLGTNWLNVPGVLTTNQIDLPINSTNSAVFYRLMSQ